jgi:photosystem II stability/assembly factor-like uncharacterized protein
MYRIVIILLVFAALVNISFSQSQTLYAVTRATSTYRIGQSEFPAIGLFSSRDLGKTWEHYGWYYSKCFSVSVVETSGENCFFYLSCGNGILKSSDCGKSWGISTGWAMTECLKTAVHPDYPDVIYAATAYGIFKSSDGGSSWVEKNRGLTSTFTGDIFVDPDHPQELYCATESGIHKSENGADLWQPVALLGKGIRTIVQHPKHPELMAAGTEDDGVFISRDHGKTWISRKQGLDVLTVYAIAFTPQERETLYAGTYKGGIYKSTNLGALWQPLNQGLKMKKIHALAVNPQNQKQIFAGTMGDGVWKSDNGGTSWQFTGLETSEVWYLVFK